MAARGRMARRNYDVPEDFFPLAREFAKRVIEYSPEDIAKFGAGYFSALASDDLEEFFGDQAQFSPNFGQAEPSFGAGRSNAMPEGPRRQLSDIFEMYAAGQQGYMALVEFLLIARYFIPDVAILELRASLGIKGNSDDKHIPKDVFLEYSMQVITANLLEEDFQAGIQLVSQPIVKEYIKTLQNQMEAAIDSDFPDVADWDQFSLARAGSLKGIQRLLDAKVNVADTDSTGKTALHLAAILGHKRIAALLVSAGAPVTDTILRDSLSDDMRQVLSAAADTQQSSGAKTETNTDPATDSKTEETTEAKIEIQTAVTIEGPSEVTEAPENTQEEEHGSAVPPQEVNVELIAAAAPQQQESSAPA